MLDFFGADGRLDLEKVFEEIEWLYKEYGLEPDENLSIDGRELKEKILWFVDKVAGLSYYERSKKTIGS